MRSLLAVMVVLLPVTAVAETASPAVDESLYSCKTRTGQVAVTFKPETELKDLITWVMGFTCKNFMLDPRIVSTGKKVTVIAPNKMSAGRGVQRVPRRARRRWASRSCRRAT